MFSADAAEARGAQIWPISWTRREDPVDLTPGEREAWVVSQVEPVLNELGDPQAGSSPLLIGKSLGSHAAVIAMKRMLPAVWLTPLLTADPVVAALRQATAPCLLVGGTADPFWDGPLARQLSAYVLEVEGANHGMYVPGPLASSASVLGQVATVVEEFLDGVLWPTTPARDVDLG
ncbi:alpha/beta hydrolase [Micromonospora craterilacus]|uniref:Alpha/beta hydrolase n=2 Tax=Micromonospora craterilacus TaxID=1655439 RepID=A0A2W2E2K4_9ACTN|nr:alpha/beta hydrolase [Micromonospora craterilacus]